MHKPIKFKILIFASILFISKISFCQSFHFNELIEMTESKTAFEKKMMLKGNIITDHTEFNLYRIRTEENPKSCSIEANPPFTSISKSEKIGFNGEKKIGIIDYSIGTMYNSTFAEGYNKVSNAASTWYHRTESSTECIIGEILRSMSGDRLNLSIQFSAQTDYLSILNEIISNCEYEGIENTEGTYIQKFVYKGYFINCEQREKTQHIVITKELK